MSEPRTLLDLLLASGGVLVFALDVERSNGELNTSTSFLEVVPAGVGRVVELEGT